MEGKLSFLGRCALAALAYGLVYAMLRAFSLSGISAINWIPVASLRFVCLLLTPTKYWPALLIGETVALAHDQHQDLDVYGLPWMLATSIPPLLYCAPVVYLMRKQLPNFQTRLSQKNVAPLLICMLFVSLTAAIYGTFLYTLPLQRGPNEVVMPLWFFSSRLLTSGYLSLLTVTPSALWIAWKLKHTDLHHLFGFNGFHKALKDPRCRGTCMLLAVILILVTTEHVFGDGIRYLVSCGILAALTTAAWRYDWQSSAIVSAAANLGIITLMTERNDLVTIQLQCALAVVISGLLLLGMRTTAARQLAKGIETSRRMARQELFAMERNRLAYACELDEVFSDARKETTRMLHSIRTTLPSGTLSEHYHRFDALHQEHQRLTACMSPRAWWESSGPNGPIAEALELLGVNCDMDQSTKETDLLRLPAELCIALYRLSCEAAVYLTQHSPTDHVRLASTTQELDASMTVSVTLESLGLVLSGPDDPALPRHECLQAALGATGLNEQDMRQRAQLYDGGVRITHTSPGHLCIVLWVRHRPTA